MSLSNCLQPQNVIFRLEVRSKEQLLRMLSVRAARAASVEEAHVLAALNNREKLGSTGVGRGVAIPHAPLAGIKRPFVLLASLKKPIGYESIDDGPVDIVFLVLSPSGDASAALKVLSCAARALRNEGCLKMVRAARDYRELLNVIELATVKSGNGTFGQRI